MAPDDPVTATSLAAECDWLAGTPVALVDGLLAASSVRRLERDQIVYRSGGPAELVFVLLDGRVGAWRSEPGSPVAAERGVWYFITDAPFTTLCIENVITGIDYFATMRSMSAQTCVLDIPRNAVETLVGAHPPVGLAIARHIARRLQAFTEQSVDFAVLDAHRRVAKYLVVSTNDTQEFGPVNQSELAARLATSRQTVNAALNQFRRRGWIVAIGDASYRIADPAALAHYAGGPSRTGAELFL